MAALRFQSLILSLLLSFSFLRISTASSLNDNLGLLEKTTTSSSSAAASSMEISGDGSNTEDDDIRIVFSDVDGTLVHYPENRGDQDDDILQLPPSATGLVGIISAKTLVQCQELRRRQGKKLVLVSGMRTTTLLRRLPYLPIADAYCCEAGGRIFYPTTQHDYIVPKPYAGAEDLSPYGLVEDREWRKRMQATTGLDGYVGQELDDLMTSSGKTIPFAERTGLLWEFASNLSQQGFVLDTKGYATCFRVNRKHQTDMSSDEFVRALSQVSVPEGLASSTNLGCFDFYPAQSGKKHCCQYLAERFCGQDDSNKADLLARHALCLCDDDNDLEMALACQNAFIPSISSISMADIIDKTPKLVPSFGSGIAEGTTKATEQALSLVLSRVSRK